MDIVAIQGFLDQNDHSARSRAFQYFEQLKASDNGWQLSVECLLSGQQHVNEPVKFFCFQVLANYVKTRYQDADHSHQLFMKNFISHWIHMQAATIPEPLVIRNKAAQIICMVFLVDYPSRWSTFFEDLLQTINLGPVTTEFYLRILLAINSEIADRETSRSSKEMEVFTLIKDRMRDTCIKELVDSWHHILVSSHRNNQQELVCLCLNVIGGYIAWIDIKLIANDHFVSLFVTFLSVPVIRDATCDCIHEIINKGMEPVPKIKLIESFMVLLEQAGVMDENEKNEEFLEKVGSLINGFGTTIISCWSRLLKLSTPENRTLAENAVRNKVALLLKFLNNEDKDVSQSVIEFTREYLQFLKHQANAFCYEEPDIANVKAILYIVINRYKYDSSANFTAQGYEEALFDGYRKSLKNIFDNLALLDIDVVFNCTKEMIVKVLHEWRNRSFEDVEAAITFLYFLGEYIPMHQHASQAQNPALDERRAAMAEMAIMLVSCGVINHGHVAVTLQYFETIVRFEKFFAQQPQHIPEILVAFMDSRGLRNNDVHVRSRTSYLFSRFIKSLKGQVQNYTEEILKQLQDLLILAPPENGVMIAVLSPDDQLYLYETAALLILNGHLEPEQKQLFLKNLLTPVFEKFEALLQRLHITTDEQLRHSIAKSMNHAIAVTSRTSKAFSSQLTMKCYGCETVYLKALEVFLGALNLSFEQITLQSAVRQYLHRMVVCLEDEVLPYFPIAAEQLLKASDIRSIQEFIPLINQVIIKFKKKIIPFLQQIFMPLVTIIFNNLSAPIEEGDQHAQNERQLLQRSYFLFISAIISNHTAEVMASQDIQSLQQVLITVIQGAVDFPDPVAQKTCFGILKKMVELWAGNGGLPGFVEFVYGNIIPACFMAPMKNSFDLADAQTILALSESALCMKMILEKIGDELLVYLQNQYLPTINVSAEDSEAYCRFLKGEVRVFKRYSKVFFIRQRL